MLPVIKTGSSNYRAVYSVSIHDILSTLEANRRAAVVVFWFCINSLERHTE